MNVERTEVPEEFRSGPALATEKQMNFLKTLLASRELPDEARDAMKARVDANAVSKSRASDWISRLLERPKLAQTLHQAGGQRNVLEDARTPPAGRYALRGDDGVCRFYRIDRPNDGMWAGRTFVHVQASDEFHPVRRESQAVILSAIFKDPEAASLLYGREIGRCGVCGRTLTDETSRERGIGPICAKVTGWGL